MDRSSNLWFTELAPVGGFCVVVCLQAYFALKIYPETPLALLTSFLFCVTLFFELGSAFVPKVVEWVCINCESSE